jgi:hypothetical protein
MVRWFELVKHHLIKLLENGQNCIRA